MLEKRAKDYAETRAKYLFAEYKSQPRRTPRCGIVRLLEINLPDMTTFVWTSIYLFQNKFLINARIKRTFIEQNHLFNAGTTDERLLGKLKFKV